jgi:hypothetical protein
MTRKIKTFLVYCPYINGKDIAGEIAISCTMEVPMARGGPKPELVVTAGQREQLESLANSRSLPAGFVMRRGSFDARQTRT